MDTNSTPLFLSEGELFELTGVRRTSAQKRWLALFNVPFRVNARGRVIVLRSHFVAQEQPKHAKYVANVPEKP
tara:strand:- start:1852 stop:2070 length:219 start_codon:yes stop_codon:yes gene_type:complete